jgi:signal transduction histidine kinase
VKADELLSQIDAELQTALEDLRDLARGSTPRSLLDKGLAAALEAQASRSPVHDAEGSRHRPLPGGR